MSYAGPSRSHASIRTGGAPSAADQLSRSGRSAAGYTPYPVATRGDTDWQEVALFGAGLALGMLLGAGGALLAAPRTGAETRAALRARAGHLRRSTARRGRDAWDELGDELRGDAMRRGRNT